MLLRSPGPISPDTYSGHIRRRALCPNRLRNGMSQRSSSSCQSDILPTMVGPSKSRPPMSHRKTDLGIPCRSKSAKVVLVAVAILAMVIVPPALAKAKRAQSARPQQGYQSSERPGYYHGYPLSDWYRDSLSSY